MLYEQERRAGSQPKRFADLDGNSTSTAGADCPTNMPSALCPLDVQPYGQDAVFNPFSDIFDEGLPGLEKNYYNLTEVSVCLLHKQILRHE